MKQGVIPAGFEPATHSLEGCCSIQLSYETILFYFFSCSFHSACPNETSPYREAARHLVKFWKFMRETKKMFLSFT